MPEIETVPLVLLPCTSCSRTFRPEALAKHAKVCEKTLLRKRKQFDSAKQRIAGTDLAQFVTTQSQLGLRRKPPSPKEEEQVRRKFSIPKDTAHTAKPPSKWKEKHEELVATIRSSRSGEVAAPRKPADHEQCPHCQRYFGPKSYDRHVEWCKEQQHKAKAKGDAQAKERLQARTKYQAPLIKSQRTLTKEKFSPTKNPARSPPASKENSAYKTVCSSASSSPPVSRSKTTTSSDRFSSTTRSNSLKLKSPLISRRRTPSVCSGGGSSSQSDCAVTSGSPRRVRNPAQRDLDKYDPFVSAELQMMELLKGDNGDTKQAVHIVQAETDKLSEVQPEARTEPSQPDEPEPSPVGPGRLLSLSTLSLCSTVSIDSMDLNANNRVRRAASASRIKPSMQSLLYGEDKFNNNTSSSADLAACEAELLESMIEFEKILNSPLEPNPSQPHIDSAYSSLSRRSPGENTDADVEPSRFCHECGGRYPVPSAKFCCLCGVRRLAIA